MLINNGYDEDAVVASISKSLAAFYISLIEKVDAIDVPALMKSKNPYLYRAKAVNTAQEIINSVLLAYISSSEETLFGNLFFEPLVIAASGGDKSTASGVDVEVRDRSNNMLYSIAVKSGTSVFNADSKKKQEENFSAAKKRAAQNHLGFEPIIGYAYGQKRVRVGKFYTELAGEDFWTAVTGDPDFYKKIIRFMGDHPERYLEKFKASYAKAQNRLVRDFANLFCDEDGTINWERLVEYNSGSRERMEAEAWAKAVDDVRRFVHDNPHATKRAISEATGLPSSGVDKAMKAAGLKRGRV